ncbi:MAG: hypothetical protein JSC189_000598 [Candidatus Tokpelaia sp. JSC189]|nr:MAG: hypothetical protein JSC189_000598 [Candidatus Tokpelaia sp. JSC189]
MEMSQTLFVAGVFGFFFLFVFFTKDNFDHNDPYLIQSQTI